MVVVITDENRAEYKQELAAMHRHRKQVFVDFLKWNIPVVDEVYEIDQFDNSDAVYLVVLDPDARKHLGSIRLIPSTKPHILESMFPFLCEGPVPVAEDIWEITRLCTAPNAPNPKLVLGQLATGLMEFGLLYGVRKFTFVTHMGALSQVLAFGWNCEPLGLPQKVSGDEIGAMLVNVDTQSLHMCRKKLGTQKPLLRLPTAARAA